MTRTATFKGLIGTKLGMTQIFDENARVVPVTVIQAGPNTVTQVKSPERDGYSAVQLAYGEIKPKRVTKPRAGHFAKAGVEARRHLVELRTADAGEYTLGQELKADVFAPGDRVDVGEKIGNVGCTGSCSGPHLHFELWTPHWYDGGEAFDPLHKLKHWDENS